MTRALVADAGGDAARLLLVCPSFAVRGFAPSLRAVLARRPPAAVTIVAHAGVADLVRAWPEAEGATVVEAADDRRLSMWAQDAFLAAEGPQLLRTRGRPRAVADLVGLPAVDVPVEVDGGNVLAGEDFVLVGADCARRNGAGFAEEFRAHVDRRRALHVLGVRVPVPAQAERRVGSGGATWSDIRFWRNRADTVQPLFHLDLFVTPAGGRRVLVGDPAAAARLCGHAPWPHAMQDAFDDIARQLDGSGFEVIRNPLPLIYMDEAAAQRRTWYFASSNNVLVSGDTVWLPSFGHDDWPELAATDAANAAIWRDLGYAVVTVGDLRALAENLGGIRCLVKCLARA